MYRTTSELAAEIEQSRVTVWRACRDNPGFALRLGKSFRIPQHHVDRLMRGETPAQIAADVRVNGLARSV
jgi:hypothetical protein